jgi:hypothetical protein
VIPIGVPVSRRLRPPERLPLAEVVRYHQP